MQPNFIFNAERFKIHAREARKKLPHGNDEGFTSLLNLTFFLQHDEEIREFLQRELYGSMSRETTAKGQKKIEKISLKLSYDMQRACVMRF